MNSAISFFDLLIFIVLGFNTFLSLAIFLRNRESVINKTYIIFVTLLDIWIMTNYLENEPSIVGQGNLHIFLHLDFAVAILFFYAWFIFCATLSDSKFKDPLGNRINFFIFLTCIFLSTLALVGPAIISNISFYDNVVHFEDGPLFLPYGIFILCCSIGGLILLFIDRRKAKAMGLDHKVYQDNMVFWGFLLALGNATIVNLFLQPFFNISLEVSRLGLYGMTFLVLFVAYAIVKHQLFNLQVIATETVTFLLVIVLLSKIPLTGSWYNALPDIIVFLLALVLGIILIKSVRKEVEQRERLEVLTTQLEEKNRQLEKLDRLKSQFLSFASHQVKTPMAVVKGYAELIIDGSMGRVNEKVKGSARKIKEVADRLMGLVSELLDMRKIEEGKMTYDLQPVNLAALAEAHVRELKGMAKEHGLELGFISTGKDVMVNADMLKVQQVIQNLIDNAIKYTPKGWIRVEVVHEAGLAKFSVKDSGLGMSEELQGQLFEQFMRDQNARKLIQGTGLGLYIAKQIIEGHGGKIWAKSEGEGKGSEFGFSLDLLK